MSLQSFFGTPELEKGDAGATGIKASATGWSESIGLLKTSEVPLYFSWTVHKINIQLTPVGHTYYLKYGNLMVDAKDVAVDAKTAKRSVAFVETDDKFTGKYNVSLLNLSRVGVSSDDKFAEVKEKCAAHKKDVAEESKTIAKANKTIMECSEELSAWKRVVANGKEEIAELQTQTLTNKGFAQLVELIAETSRIESMMRDITAQMNRVTGDMQQSQAAIIQLNEDFTVL